MLFVIMNILVACTAFQPEEVAAEPIRVEFTQWWGDYTLIIAQEKGFFEKYGVVVEPVYYEVFSDTYPDLASGQIDGALIAVGDIININRSANMKILAISDDGSFMSIMARPEINTVEDLKGKTIGVLIGTQYELMVSEMLRSANMEADDVNVVAMNPEDASVALRNNRVQAVFTWEPFLSDAILDGNKVIYPTDRSLRLFPDMIVFRESLVEERPDDIKAFLQAWFEAVDYRLQNPQETRSIVANYLGIDIEKVQPDDNLKILTLDDNKAFFNIENENSVYAIAKITSEYLISIGAVAQQIDPLELLDPSYLP
ncbi:MAG: ABC transporter substrate-binding protein [Anaerolineales bacterium]|nr:ABC transporter substrate-binding protein [Anaerolineales bacterium]